MFKSKVPQIVASLARHGGKRRDTISYQPWEYKTALRYAFLFDGYKAKYCYWELVVVLRKVCMVIVVVFFNYSIQIQSLLALLLVLIFLCIQINFRPFIDYRVNILEILSLMTSAVTFYCGQYLFVPNVTLEVKVMISCVIIIFNVAFFVCAIGGFIFFTLDDAKKNKANKEKRESIHYYAKAIIH